MTSWIVRLVGGVVVALGAGVAVPVVANAAVPAVVDCVSHRVVKPSKIVFTCADNTIQVVNIRWQSWGGRYARGTGTEHENQCVPNCATGEWVVFPVRITLSTPMNGVFTRATTTPTATGKEVHWTLPTR